MKKTALALTLIISAVFSSLAIESQNAITVRGNPIIPISPGRYDEPPLVFVFSPMNKTYTENVSMSFTVYAPVSGWSARYGPISQLLSVDYYIDGSFQGSIIANSNLSSPFHYSAPLPYLQNGNHTFMVKTNSVGFEVSSDGRISNLTKGSASGTVHFNVTRESSVNSFQTVSKTMVVVVAAMVVIGLFVYWKKPKGVKNP